LNRQDAKNAKFFIEILCVLRVFAVKNDFLQSHRVYMFKEVDK